MAVTTSILKKGRIEAAVKFVGSGTTTFTLSSLKRTEETLGTPAVNIHAIYWANNTGGGPINVTRNSVLQYSLDNAGQFQLNGFDDADNNTYDIAIDLGTQPGTLILDLRKISGFTVPDDQHNG